MENINYTFIIPHKNIPDLLQRCLNSIPRREDIQIIVVDDNSDPDKVDFEHFPGVGEPCVEVYFTKEGKGAGYARNVGLKHAKGKWLLFADADDYFINLSYAYFDEILVDNSDIIYFSPCSTYSDTGLPADRHRYYESLIEDFLQNKSFSEKRLRYNFGPPWCKIIHKSMLDEYSITFDEIKYSNDVMFSVKIGRYAKRIRAIPNHWYCVTVNQGSLVNQYSKDSLFSRYKVVLAQNAFLRSIGEFECQKSIIHYLRRSLQYGIETFGEFLKVGIESRADFSVGYKTWLRSLFLGKWLIMKDRKYIVRK